MHGSARSLPGKSQVEHVRKRRAFRSCDSAPGPDLDIDILLLWGRLRTVPQAPIESKPIKVKEFLVEDFAQLMQRLLEIQSGGRPRSLELIAEDERLMDALQKRNLAGKPTQTAQASEDGSERVPIQGLTFFAADSGSTDEEGCEP